MFALVLNALDCVSCGTCMDVCPPRAIDMHLTRKAGVEQWRLKKPDTPSADAGTGSEGAGFMTFPFLAAPERCDGCGVCVRECPTVALELRTTADPAPHTAPALP